MCILFLLLPLLIRPLLFTAVCSCLYALSFIFISTPWPEKLPLALRLKRAALRSIPVDNSKRKEREKREQEYYSPLPLFNEQGSGRQVSGLGWVTNLLLRSKVNMLACIAVPTIAYYYIWYEYNTIKIRVLFYYYIYFYLQALNDIYVKFYYVIEL